MSYRGSAMLLRGQGLGDVDAQRLRLCFGTESLQVGLGYPCWPFPTFDTLHQLFSVTRPDLLSTVRPRFLSINLCRKERLEIFLFFRRTRLPWVCPSHGVDLGESSSFRRSSPVSSKIIDVGHALQKVRSMAACFKGLVAGSPL